MARDDRPPPDPDLRRSAARLLARARDGWPLTDDVARDVAALHAALHDGDVPAFRRALHDLETDGPVRATGFGQTSAVPPPVDREDRVEPTRERGAEAVRARIDDLVQLLTEPDAG